jgi:uroporphyrinogen decarboxylase
VRPDISQLINVLYGGRADYIPLAELGVHPTIKARLLGRPVASMADEVDFWHRAGYDYVKLQPQLEFSALAASGEERMDGSLAYNWATPGKSRIATRADFDAFQFPSPADISFQRFSDVKPLLPAGMGVIGQYGDIFTMAWELMGFENFSIALYTDPQLVHDIIEKVGNLVLPMFEYFARSPVVDAIWYSDDIAFRNGLMMSPQVLREYFFPWLKRIGDLARSAGKPLIYHSDGLLYDVMEDIIAAGVNALHPIEPKAMQLREVKKRFGERLCLIGHVDVDLLARGTREEVRRQVRENIEVTAQTGGYCAGSGNSIPDYVNYDNYIAMLDEVRQYRYA